MLMPETLKVSNLSLHSTKEVNANTPRKSLIVRSIGIHRPIAIQHANFRLTNYFKLDQ
jgi:hypothetical protein